MKKIMTLFVAVVLAGCQNVERKGLPLKSPEAPFAVKQKAGAEIKDNIAEINANGFRFGAKRLDVYGDGKIKLFSNNRLLSEMNAYFRTDNYIYIAPTNHVHPFENGKLVKDLKKGIFSYSAEIPLMKGKKQPTAKYKHQVSLTGDNKLKFDVEWSAEESDLDYVDGNGFFVKFPVELAVGNQFVIDGKSFVIGDKTGRLFGSQSMKNIDCFAINPADAFKLKLEERAYCWLQRNNNSVFVRLNVDRKTRKLTFIMDISKGPSQEVGSEKYAGIDFKTVEDLGMPDFKSSRNLLQNPSFEQGLMYTRFRGGFAGHKYDPENWHREPFTIDKDVAKFGESSLRIKTDKKKRLNDQRGLVEPGNISMLPCAVDAGKYTFSFYAKGSEAQGQEISVWFPKFWNQGNHHTSIRNARKTFDLTNEWKRYSLTFDVDRPIPLYYCLNAISKNGKGYVWVDGMQLEKGNELTAYTERPIHGLLVTSAKGNFLKYGDEIDGQLKVFAAPNESGKAVVVVKNFFNEVIYKEAFDFKTDAKGNALIKLPLDSINLPRGIFVCKVDYTLENGNKSHDYFRFSIMDLLENKHKHKNVFAHSYTNKETWRPDFLKLLDRQAQIGIGSRCHLHTLDKSLIDEYQKRGIKVTDSSMLSHSKQKDNGKKGIEGYIVWNGSSEWRPSLDDPKALLLDYRLLGDGKLTDDYIKNFKEAVKTVVRTHPWVNMWSLGGELSAKYPEWGGIYANDKEFKNFARIQKAFMEAVKEEDPDKLIFNGSPSNMAPDRGIKQIDRLLTNLEELGCKVKFDFIGCHSYRAKPENPDIDSDTATLLKVMDKHGYKDTPVFWGESMHWGPYKIPQWNVRPATWGAPGTWYYGALSYDMGWQEKISAAWYARTWLVVLKYSDRVKTALAGAMQNNFEMDLDLTPFAYQKIPNTLGNLLGDATFKKDIRFAPATRCYVFEDGQKRPVAAVWGFHQKLDAGISPAMEAMVDLGENVQIFDLMEGERIAQRDAKGNILFPISSFPLFFRGEPGTLNSFIKGFDNASLVTAENVMPLKLSTTVKSPEKFDVALKNRMSKDFMGKLTVGTETQTVNVDSAKSIVLNYSLPATLKDSQIVSENLPAELAESKSKGSFQKDLSFDGLLAMKTKSSIKIDGDESDWNAISEIKFTKKYYARNKPNKNNVFKGSFKVAWDDTNFYLMVNVKDDMLKHDDNLKARDRWRNDCLQVYFDTLADGRQNEITFYDENDYDYSIYPATVKSKSMAFLRRSPDPQLSLGPQAPKDMAIAPHIPTAFKKTADGYIYEAAFPLKYIMPIKLKKGSSFGMGVYVADRDKGEKVACALTIASDGKGCYNSPAKWPLVLLWE